MLDIIFKPWIGRQYYNNGGIFGKKILALGESHYFPEKNQPFVIFNKSRDFTTKMVKLYLDNKDNDDPKPSWFNTYKKFERLLVYNKNEYDSLEIWDSIAFYNYLQIGLHGPGQNVPAEYYQQSENAFFEVLEKLRPNLVIVWGVSRLWWNMPSGDFWEEIAGDIGNYKLKDGTKIKTLCIPHPSRISYEEDSKLIQQYL